MTVAKLILQLSRMPQHLPVHINDELNAVYHEDLGSIMHLPEDGDYGDVECVVIVINEQ